MHCSQLYPLQVNTTTREPFLRLSGQNDNIIITPPRLDDAGPITSLMNDVRVYQWLESPPFPYLPEHGRSWVELIKQWSDSLLSALEQEEQANPQGPLKVVGDCPVRILREVQGDGSDKYIGDISFIRCRWVDVKDEEERSRLIAENESKAVGDPTIYWSMGYYLSPAYQSRGIMSAAVGLLMSSWVIPRMGVRRMRGYTFIGNTASMKVFEKNGYTPTGTVDDCKVVRGESVGMHVFDWVHADP